MEIIKPIIIDWDKTKDSLAYLRTNDKNLIKYVCYYNKVNIDDINLREKNTCFNNYDCNNCNNVDKAISRSELAKAMGVTDDVIYNWETGKTIPDIEDLLLYSKICNKKLEDILVYKENK